VVGVWIGNADGEGRPGVIGLETAAPLLFSTFEPLPRSHWFLKPFDGLKKSPFVKTVLFLHPKTALLTRLKCAGCQTITAVFFRQADSFDKEGRFQVNSLATTLFQMTF
jgi:penicillin-binding protein 1C